MVDARSLVSRISEALAAAGEVLRGFDNQLIAEQRKAGGDPVTAADLAIDDVLKRSLLRDGDGWLSEETADDSSRLDKPLVWIVDPLDGTREFIDGLPEFCISVAAVVDSDPIAGGIVNTAAGIEVVGARGLGVTCNGKIVTTPTAPQPDPIRILASRSEVSRGLWSGVESEGHLVVPMGSVAYKLGRVAAGLDHVTWTPVPKHEWDVAGGAALMTAAGGGVVGLGGERLRFNQRRPWFSGAIAFSPGMEHHLDWIKRQVRTQLEDKK